MLHSDVTKQECGSGRIKTDWGRFLKYVVDILGQLWDAESCVDEKSNNLKSATIFEEAEATLVYEDRKSQISLEQNGVVIKPLLEERSRIYALWLRKAVERYKANMP